MQRSVRIAATAAGLLLALCISACGGGGGGETSSPPPPAPKLGFDESGSSFAEGRVVGLTLENAVVSLPLSADISGTAATVIQDDSGALLLLVPEMAAGSYTLNLRSGSLTLALPITVRDTAVPADTAAYLSDFTTDAQAALDERLAAVSGDEADYYNQLKTRLSETQDDFAALTAAERITLVRYLEANGLTAALQAGTFTAKSADPKALSQCEKAGVAAGIAITSAVISAKALAVGIDLPLIAGDLKTALITGSAISLGVSVGFAYTAIDLVSEECFEKVGDLILKEITESFTSKAVVAGPTFNHKKTKQFTIQTTEHLSDQIASSLQSASQSLGARIRQVRLALADFGINLPSTLETRFLSLVRDRLIDALTTDFRLIDISDARIDGTSGGSGKKLQLTFAWKQGQMPAQPAPFSFGFQEIDSGRKVTVYSSRLNVQELPIAESGSISVPQGLRFSGRLQAEFADRYRIVSQPTHGTLTLDDEATGAATYRSADEYVGPDSFRYVGINDRGESTAATIDITVVGCAYRKEPGISQPTWTYRYYECGNQHYDLPDAGSGEVLIENPEDNELQYIFVTNAFAKPEGVQIGRIQGDQLFINGVLVTQQAQRELDRTALGGVAKDIVYARANQLSSGSPVYNIETTTVGAVTETTYELLYESRGCATGDPKGFLRQSRGVYQRGTSQVLESSFQESRPPIADGFVCPTLQTVRDVYNADMKSSHVYTRYEAGQ